MAKTFMYVCVGLMALAGAFSFGAGSVKAQLGDNEITHFAATENGSNDIYYYVVTPSGDIYRAVYPYTEWVLSCNFPGSPVATDGESLNDLKARFR